MAGSIADALGEAGELCRRFEGFRAAPYLCPAGVPTIGYGSTFYPDGTKVALTDTPITPRRADEMLEHELARLVAPVTAACPLLLANAARLAAILDFTYNLGIARLRASTLRQRVNAQDWRAAQSELRRWVRGGGKILPGLVARREAECAIISY